MSYFAFRDTFYLHIQGTAMSSLVSVVVADLVMEDVESRALSTFPNILAPKFWKRYVDDTWCTLRSDIVQDFHCHSNTIEDTIQFTLEREAQAQLAFLDVLILLNPDKTIDTTVYRKPTHTNKYQARRLFFPPPLIPCIKQLLSEPSTTQPRPYPPPPVL